MRSFNDLSLLVLKKKSFTMCGHGGHLGHVARTIWTNFRSLNPRGSIWNLTFVCLCWGLTSQSTIFQSCRDGATASWVINQYFRGVKCLAQGHNTAAVGIEPPTSRSGVRHSTTEPPRSPEIWLWLAQWFLRGRCLKSVDYDDYIHYKLTNEPSAEVS